MILHLVVDLMVLPTKTFSVAFSIAFLKIFAAFLFDLFPASLGFKDISSNLDVECLPHCMSGIVKES